MTLYVNWEVDGPFCSHETNQAFRNIWQIHQSFCWAFQTYWSTSSEILVLRLRPLANLEGKQWVFPAQNGLSESSIVRFSTGLGGGHPKQEQQRSECCLKVPCINVENFCKKWLCNPSGSFRMLECSSNFHSRAPWCITISNAERRGIWPEVSPSTKCIYPLPPAEN